MVEDKITISNPTGLHTRPAKKVVAEAKKFESNILLKTEDKEASAKSLLKIMKLGLSQHMDVTIACDGPDEAEALAHVKDFLLNLED